MCLFSTSCELQVASVESEKHSARSLLLAECLSAQIRPHHVINQLKAEAIRLGKVVQIVHFQKYRAKADECGVPKDQIVYTQGEPADSVFYIQSGRLSLPESVTQQCLKPTPSTIFDRLVRVGS